jgi:thymidylate kinase
MVVHDSPTEVKNRIQPLSRAMFIGGHLVAQYEYLVRPLLDEGADVVLDSYYYKLLAKERLFKVCDPVLERLCSELPQPDLVIVLHVSPADSYLRKDGLLSPYEYIGRPTPEDYIRFQTALAQGIWDLLDGHPFVQEVRSDRPPETIADQVCRIFQVQNIAEGA